MVTTSQLNISDHRLTWLRSAFKKLPEVVDYHTWWNGEPPYWNNESASVSLIISAAARADYIALSDFRRSKRSQGNASNGRCDLLMARGTKWLEIEAKQIYVTPGTGKRKLDAALKFASKEAKKLWWCKHRAAMVFAILALSKEQAKTFNRKAFLQEIKPSKCGLRWYWFDSECDRINYKFNKNGYYYPAFAVLMKKV